MKEDFVEWIQEGILEKIISLKTAEELYSALFKDFDGGNFKKFIFSF